MYTTSVCLAKWAAGFFILFILSGSTPLFAPIFVPSSGDYRIFQDNALLDISNVSDGYIKVQYKGAVPLIVVRVEKPALGLHYDYHIIPNGNWKVLPLTMGSGTYNIFVLEHMYGRMFRILINTSVEVSLSNYLYPFLYPNVYVNFHAGSAAVARARSLAQNAADELEILNRIYYYIVSSISYDNDLAQYILNTPNLVHITDIDRTLEVGSGICLDFSALMAAMLRSLHIPARLEFRRPVHIDAGSWY